MKERERERENGVREKNGCSYVLVHSSKTQESRNQPIQASHVGSGDPSHYWIKPVSSYGTYWQESGIRSGVGNQTRAL